MSERASTVIPLPLSVVESNIWDVTCWPTFLVDVESTRRVSHERYLFAVREGRRVHETPVAVRWRPQDHRVTWREIEGPQWRGEIRLTPLNGRRTRVALEVIAHPRGLIGRLAEMLGTRHRDPELDLQRLAERMSTIRQPLNPTRLTTTQQSTTQQSTTQQSTTWRPTTRKIRARSDDTVPVGGGTAPRLGD